MHFSDIAVVVVVVVQSVYTQCTVCSRPKNKVRIGWTFYYFDKKIDDPFYVYCGRHALLRGTVFATTNGSAANLISFMRYYLLCVGYAYAIRTMNGRDCARACVT